MIAVDTNILVYAHRQDSPFHAKAKHLIEQLANAPSPWGIPWPCAHEFIAVVTHRRIFLNPTALSVACDQLRTLSQSSSFLWFSEGTEHLDMLSTLASKARVEGPAIHDARIAALCVQHGVSELWSADRDFNRYPELPVRNPLVD